MFPVVFLVVVELLLLPDGVVEFPPEDELDLLEFPYEVPFPDVLFPVVVPLPLEEFPPLELPGEDVPLVLLLVELMTVPLFE